MEVIVGFRNTRVIKECNTYQEASEIFCSVRDSKGYGASDMVLGCGDVMSENEKIGEVSYNGKVFGNDGTLLFNPCLIFL
jgi:hypothetical protein